MQAAEWPHWRGPAHNGVTVESSGWNGKAWPPKEPLWTTRVGEGCTSPIVAGGRLYTLGWRSGQDTVVCLDSATGSPHWSQSYQAPKYGRHAVGDQQFYSGPTATPEFDPQTGFLYTLGVDGQLHCWKDGTAVWSVNLYDRYGAGRRPDVGRNSRRDYGYTAAPLVHGETLVVEVGASDGTLMGFDKRTGQRRWTSQCRDEAGHTGGPVPVVVDDVPCVAVLTLRNLLVARLDPGHEGQTVATYAWATHFANNIPSPAVHGNEVLITSAYNHSELCKLRITLSGAEKVWGVPNPSGVCTPVIHRGHIYWAWHGVHCVDFKTGKETWRLNKVGDPGSCIVTGDDRLLVWSDQGSLMLLETARRSPTKATLLAQSAPLFGADAWPHVVLAEGRLYCKDRDGTLKCFAL
jgi:outer membrane protein assembly factor BamB